MLDSLSEGNPGANSAALGDVQHGRAQDRFLSGWKKKTYGETDDFDPKWLMDSMNLDFDTGRRFSMTGSSPPSRPIFVITEDGTGGSRRRRVGLVEPPPLNSLAEGTSKEEAQETLKRNYTPSTEIVRLELDIKEYERRKSRGAATSLGVPVSSESLQINHKALTPPPPPTEDWVTDDDQSSNSKDKDSVDVPTQGNIFYFIVIVT